jgi:hypothetical protein
MIKLTIGVVLAGCFALAGCGPKTGAAGDDGIDAGPGADCTDGSQCPAEYPICSTSGVCVGCESSADCSDPTPVCSNTTCTEACAGSEVMADFQTRPSDIIFIVDQSGSMNQETAYVQMKINDFVMQISASNIDYRVVMIASPTASNAICVPPPLGGPSCGNNTRFRLVNQSVGSTNGPSLALSRYAMYSDFLRPEAGKHFVFVTDDNSSMSAANFTSGVNALLPAGMFTGFKVHGIYAYGSGSNGCTGAFGSGAAAGTVYTTLIAQTMGASGVICTGDWTQVFMDITAAVVSGSQVSCELTIPAPPMGETLDPAKVNVKYQSGVAPGMTLPQVPAAADCTSAGGWYYDDNTTPTKITLCPATCTSVQGDPMANVKVEFGCSTQIF